MKMTHFFLTIWVPGLCLAEWNNAMDEDALLLKPGSDGFQGQTHTR